MRKEKKSGPIINWNADNIKVLKDHIEIMRKMVLGHIGMMMAL